jgi:hypothetical protein
MYKRGRPKSSKLPRAEQLRRAKHAQRQRQRAAGWVEVQLKLPRSMAEKLRITLSNPESAAEFEHALDQTLIHVADYPALADIAWSQHRSYIPAREAFALYERNWRFVNLDKLDNRERALIENLSARYGSGVIHA